MAEKWTAPEFREISLGGECTAYAGAEANPTSAPQKPAWSPAPVADVEAREGRDDRAG
jgi:coenzyme PQQ precursor peptide PqqA